MTPLAQRVLDEIDTDWLLALLADLVAIPSLGGRETPAQERVADALREIGCDVDVWEIDLPALARHPAFGAEVGRSEALGVVGSFGDGDGPTLVLNGHVDVVPCGDPLLWRHPPWQATVDDGRVYGRGAVDMKGGLCCALAAARALARAGVRPRGRLLVHSVVGEEDGGTGTLATVLRGHTGDAAIVCEPTDLTVIPAQAGALNFRVTVTGRSAHGALRDEGVSAVEMFELVHGALRELEAKRNAAVHHPLFAAYRLPIPLSIGRLRAGDWPSTVPEELVAEGRYGVALGEDLGSARRELEDALHDLAQRHAWLLDHPPRVVWWGGQFASAQVAADHAVVQTVRAACRDVLGAEPAVAGVTYGSDMRLLVNEGHTPAILFGPGDVRRAHAPDEYVELAALETCARVLAVAALRFWDAG